MTITFSLRSRLTALAVVAGLFLAAPVSAQQPKLDEAVAEAVRGGHAVRAIVRFTDGEARLRGRDKVLARGGGVRRALNEIESLNVLIDAATVTELQADPGVARISIDAEVRAASSQTGKVVAAAARASGARKVREALNKRGTGIAVAVIDSGVQPHVDLPAHRIRAFVDFVNGRTQPYDDFGHGTHVAGIVAGSGAASAAQTPPYTGAAPDVDIVALKVLDGNGAGKTSDVIAALEWVRANHKTYNIRVVNLSLGHPIFEPAGSDPLVLAAESLVRQGIVVVASAGNMGINPTTGLPGYGGITSPANAPSVIAVGAVDTHETLSRFDDTVTNYSSRGPTRFDLQAKPDLVAAGHRAVSLSSPGSHLFENYPGLQVYGGAEAVPAYMRLSGTSMAAPMVAGTAALMLDANPKMSANTVKAVLQFTSQRLDGVDTLTQGAGYLNATGSVRLARAINPNVKVGQGWLRKTANGRNVLPEPSDLINDERVEWSQNIVWGNKTLLGNSAYVRMAFWDDNIVWGFWHDNIVWGLMDDNIVWGMNDNIVWGFTDDNIVWGMTDDNIVWGMNDDNIVWGMNDNIVWGMNLVWGDDNIVWGYWADNIVWGFWDDNIVWGQVSKSNFDNIVWGQDWLDNIVWGQNDDNIVWGMNDGDNIVWGQMAILTQEGF
ncbi:MAG: S8 family peptidase [Acidobacteriota bacterium]|nr:S8 family peptidase [Acidobacteriota bacterium]